MRCYSINLQNWKRKFPSLHSLKQLNHDLCSWWCVRRCVNNSYFCSQADIHLKPSLFILRFVRSTSGSPSAIWKHEPNSFPLPPTPPRQQELRSRSLTLVISTTTSVSPPSSTPRWRYARSASVMRWLCLIRLRLSLPWSCASSTTRSWPLLLRRRQPANPRWRWDLFVC